MAPRIQIQNITPLVDCGRYPVKACVGDEVRVEATIFRDGHEVLGAALRTKGPGATRWRETPMDDLGNDRWAASFAPDSCGRWSYRVEGWVDPVRSFQWELRRKVEGGQKDLSSELEEAALLLAREQVTVDEALEAEPGERLERTASETLRADVDTPLARFGAWYELFPRSWGGFEGVEAQLARFSELGFDVLYLPPVHPIGRTNRKGPNNTLTAGPDDPGSPWAIGAEEGGHTAVNPELGTLEDFERLVAAARKQGIEVALDYAIQCSPDHPWLKEHPEWFHRRPDGTLKYAENPPKRYQDIVPLAFDTPAWASLWEALADTIRVWRRLGVRTFRVDNPHTKPLAFWEWAIAELKREDPGLIFLAEAFAHPELMLELSRLGFTQSYTHFPWQRAPWQLRDYYAQMLRGDEVEHFRGAAWPNTPDILTAELQGGLRQTFLARLILAATLNATYGIYGPPFELLQHEPVREGSEEYLDSEKYQLRSWQLDDPRSLAREIRLVNEIRRTHRALHHDRSLVFHGSDDEAFVVYSKLAPEWPASDGFSDDPILVVVNTDHANTRETIIHLDLIALGLDDVAAIEAHDLLTGATYIWRGWHHYVRLDPWEMPAHVFALRPAG